MRKNLVFAIFLFTVLFTQAQEYLDYEWVKNPALHEIAEEDVDFDEIILKHKIAYEVIKTENGTFEYKLEHEIVKVNSDDAI